MKIKIKLDIWRHSITTEFKEKYQYNNFITTYLT